MPTDNTTQPELYGHSSGKKPFCSVCCAEVGERHDSWCNGTGTVTDPRDLSKES